MLTPYVHDLNLKNFEIVSNDQIDQIRYFPELLVIEQNFQPFKHRNSPIILLTVCFYSELINHHLLCDLH